MNLSEIVLDNIVFEANGKSYELRPMNLEDQGRFQKLFGLNWTSVLDEGNVEAVVKIAYLLLKSDKEEYKIRREEEVGLDGKITKRHVGGWELFAREFAGDYSSALLVDKLRDAIVAGRAEPVDDGNSEGAEQEPGKQDTI